MEVEFKNLIILRIFENVIRSLIRRDSILMITLPNRSSAERYHEMDWLSLAFPFPGRDRTRRNERLKNNDELTNYSQTGIIRRKLHRWYFWNTVISIQRREVQLKWAVTSRTYDREYDSQENRSIRIRMGQVTSVSTKKSRSRRSEREETRTLSRTMSSKRFSVSTFLNEKEASVNSSSLSTLKKHQILRDKRFEEVVSPVILSLSLKTTGWMKKRIIRLNRHERVKWE